MFYVPKGVHIKRMNCEGIWLSVKLLSTTDCLLGSVGPMYGCDMACLTLSCVSFAEILRKSRLSGSSVHGTCCPPESDSDFSESDFLIFQNLILVPMT